jgi:phytoene dehydrogenase-like protein
MKSDVVIIGGGIAGMATGALLAQQGKRVVVLEKGNQPGGRAYCYTDKGFVLNYGAHGMYRPESGLLGDIMAKLGRAALTGGFPNDAMRAYWSDGDRWGVVGAKPHELMLRSDLLPIASRIRMVPLMLALRGVDPQKIAPEMLWSEWVNAHTSDELLRRFVMMLTCVNTYSRHAGGLSAQAVARHLKDNLFAKDYVCYLSGGWARIFDAFTDVMTDHGSTLVTGARVDSLELRDGRAVAAIAGGKRYEADAFVCAMPPQDAPSIAEPGSPLASELAQWSSLTDVRAVCIDLGLSRAVRTDLNAVFDVERELYFSIHSSTTPDLAPPGTQLLQAMAYLSPEEASSDVKAAARKIELEAGLDRFFPGWRDAIAVERVLPNVRVTSARRTPEQYGQGGVPLRVSSATNLYFANDGRDLPYFLSLTSLAAAMEVAEAIASAPQAEPANDKREAIAV